MESAREVRHSAVGLRRNKRGEEWAACTPTDHGAYVKRRQDGRLEVKAVGPAFPVARSGCRNEWSGKDVSWSKCRKARGNA